MCNQQPQEMKVMWSYEDCKELERLNCPKTIPWKLVAPHEKRAKKNHYQSLTQLNKRGGLSPREMVALLEENSLQEVFEGKVRLSVAVECLKNHVEVFLIQAND